MKIKKTATAIAILLFSSLAFSGSVVDAPVDVDLDNNFAFGNMASARFSDNDVEFIGCGVRYIDNGAGGIFVFGFCQATDAAEESLFCSTENPDLLEAIKSIADFSFITFAADGNGQCTRIGNSTQSFYIPDLLADDLANHTHEYLTGKGAGHNNTPASTSPPSPGE